MRTFLSTPTSPTLQPEYRLPKGVAPPRNPHPDPHFTRTLSPPLPYIVNVSSTSGRVASPLFSVYAATKFGLGAFTEVLRKEVHPGRVRVTLFEPGPTRSELGSHVDPEIMESLREDSFGEVEFLGAGDVARGILWALAQPDRINVNEVLFRPTDQRDW